MQDNTKYHVIPPSKLHDSFFNIESNSSRHVFGEIATSGFYDTVFTNFGI